jgi:hypothetical protein
VIPEGEFPDESAAANSAVLRLRRLTVFGHGRGHLFRPLMHGRHEPAAGTAVFLSYSIARITCSNLSVEADDFVHQYS